MRIETRTDRQTWQTTVRTLNFCAQCSMFSNRCSRSTPITSLRRSKALRFVFWHRPVVAEVSKDCSGLVFGVKQSNDYVTRLWSLIFQQTTRRRVLEHTGSHCVTLLRVISLTEIQRFETRHACEMSEVNSAEFLVLCCMSKEFMFLYEEGLLRTDAFDVILIVTTEFLVLWSNQV